jgi:parallel beta-helix repeat protein
MYRKRIHTLSVILISALLFSACESSITTSTSTLPSPAPSFVPTITPIAAGNASGHVFYVDGNLGLDSNPGSKDQPWQTIQKAVKSVRAGDMIYVRGGQYDGIKNGWSFENSGTQTQHITISNYPGEQVILKIVTSDYNDREIFRCSINTQYPPSWNTSKADYIRIIGADVTPRILSNGVESKKGIVIQGLVGEQSKGIAVSDCDYWEIAGVDFIETADAIFTFKNNYQMMEEHSTDYWYVHDNRVYNYYRESGMQFNGNNNLIENNEIYKVSDELNSPYGCQLLNFLGNNNTIRGNTLSRLGSTADCAGLLFEWDLADNNIIEQNIIEDVPAGIVFGGGDNNIVRNNLIYTKTLEDYRIGIGIMTYDNRTTWPCNEENGGAQALLPANDPAHPDFQYYYNPRNCHSYGNQIYNNTIHGFVVGILFDPLVGEKTILRNNVFSAWTRAGICYHRYSNGFCLPLPKDLIADHNVGYGGFGFVDLQNYDFYLTSNSPLVDSGYNLGYLNPNDFDGNIRPQGAGYDIGAYELPAP